MQGASINGLTTAASVWMVAGVVLLVGASTYWLACSASLLLLITLWLARLVEFSA